MNDNAIAVHDIEHSIYGTSLGVDLQRGVAITGGHKHHIRTINMVRRAGSIPQAVAEVMGKGSAAQRAPAATATV